MRPRDRLIVALDLPSLAATRDLAAALVGQVGMVKVGVEPLLVGGPRLIEELRGMGHQIFLDLKLHDIPRTVAAATREARRLGATLLTVHASGGEDMVRAAKHEAGDDVQIIAVTVLTSLNDAALARVGLGERVSDTALHWAEVALGAGADGVVCSAYELPHMASSRGTRVVPGIRPQGSAAGDQARVATPAQAVRAGATWIVVGRPVVAAANPVAAAQAIVADLEAAA